MAYLLLYFLLLSANNTTEIHSCDNRSESIFYVSITYIDIDIDFCYALECGEIENTESSKQVTIKNPLTELKLLLLLHSLKPISLKEVSFDARRRIEFVYNNNVVFQACIDRFYVQINQTLYSYSGEFEKLVESIVKRNDLSSK